MPPAGFGPRLRCVIALGLSYLIATTGLIAAPQAANSIDELLIEIVKGDDATYNPRELTTQEFIVEVRDDNDKPVAGATVIFFLPERGAGGQFPGGAKTLTVQTDQLGRATAEGFLPGTETGEFQIRVEARYQGASGETMITQRVVAPSAPQVVPSSGGGGGGLSAAAILGIVAAAGAAVAVAVVVGGGGGDGTPPGGGPPTTPTTTITPGTPTVGGAP